MGEIETDYFYDDGGLAWGAWHPAWPEVERAIAELEENRRAFLSAMGLDRWEDDGGAPKA